MKRRLRRRALLGLGAASVLAASAAGLSARHAREVAALAVPSRSTGGRMDEPGSDQRSVGGIRGDLFGSTAAARAPARPAFVRHPSPITAPQIPVPSDPLASWVYRGWGEKDGARYAAVDNVSTGESRLLLEGENLDGFALERLERDSLILRGPAGERHLALSDDFNLLPGKHPQDSPHVAESAVDEATVQTDIKVRSLVYGLFTNVDGEDIGKLRDDAFEGRISHDEFVRRSQRSDTVIGYDLDLSIITAAADGEHELVARRDIGVRSP